MNVQNMWKVKGIRFVAILLALVTIVFVGSKTAYAQSKKPEEGKDNTTIVKTVVEEKEVRTPNKLSAKQPVNEVDPEKITVTGVRTEPSKAKATVTENVNNANNAYPIYHGEEGEKTNPYSADARQFLTFTTKNGKTFYLVIDHDVEGENVTLLTEVSEDDLLNMVEEKEKPKPEIVKEDTTQEVTKEPESPKKKESSDLGTYLIVAVIGLFALGASYYFKVVKKKEEKELSDLEEPEENFISEASESQEEEPLEDSLADEDTEDLL